MHRSRHLFSIPIPHFPPMRRRRCRSEFTLMIRQRRIGVVKKKKKEQHPSRCSGFRNPQPSFLFLVVQPTRISSYRGGGPYAVGWVIYNPLQIFRAYGNDDRLSAPTTDYLSLLLYCAQLRSFLFSVQKQQQKKKYWLDSRWWTGGGNAIESFPEWRNIVRFI